MRNIFIGYLFIFLDFNFNFNAHTLALIPDFIGFYFMVKGLKELASQSQRFTKVQPLAVGMGVYTAVLFIMDLLGMGMGTLSWVLGLVSLAISLYISYTIILGIQDIETTRDADLYSQKLKSTWMGMVITHVASYLFVWVPALALISVIAAFVLAIVYLFAFRNTKNAYEALPRVMDELPDAEV